MTVADLILKLGQLPKESTVVIQEPFKIVKHINEVRATEHGFVIIHFVEPIQTKMVF